MIEGKSLDNLVTHVTSMTSSLLGQIGTNGAVLIRNNNEVMPDITAAHHIAELLHRLDKNIFSHHLQLLINWMTSEENGLLQSQFTIDTLSQITPNNDVLIENVNKVILPTQLDSGAFTRYTAFLHGGDYFSTLWCIKILQNIDENTYENQIKKGFEYLIANTNDSGIQINQIGFLYLLLNKTKIYHNETLQIDLRQRILNYAKSADLTPSTLFTLLYLCEDLKSNPGDEDGHAISADILKRIMNTDQEPKSLPPIFVKLNEVAYESVTLQCLARACIISLMHISNNESRKIAYSVNSFLHSQGQRAAYVAIKRDIELKEYLQKFGGIHKEFTPYNDALERVWNKTPFEKSMFIMMPFRRGIAFRALTNAIRDACQERGYHAIRVDDGDRQLYDTLWDNLVANMLSCKYAVAVYVSEQVVDRVDGNEPKMFANPNVALEFGFFRSRGQKILLLKDKDSPLPSDLQGFLWNSFDIDDPKDDVIKAVNDFFDKVEKERNAELENLEGDNT